MNLSSDLFNSNLSLFVKWNHNFASNFSEDEIPLKIGEKDSFEGELKRIMNSSPGP